MSRYSKKILYISAILAAAVVWLYRTEEERQDRQFQDKMTRLDFFIQQLKISQHQLAELRDELDTKIELAKEAIQNDDKFRNL